MIPDTPVRTVRRRLQCTGRVQGVGFRPAVVGVARRLGLSGWVRNDRAGVLIEVEGDPDRVTEFQRTLPQCLPPLAALEDLRWEPVAPAGEERFQVLASETTRPGAALPPPDAVMCADCLAELRRAGDRRFGYPFTLCSHCGPRYSVVRELPYDRERTAMAVFPLCHRCGREYADPEDRRFHAEPLCCPDCGPRLRWWTARSEDPVLGEGALARARRALEAGAIVAVKGLGGFQLACRVDDAPGTDAVARLRERKHRPSQPLAVMVRDLHVARRWVRLGAADEELLGSFRGPIIVAPVRGGGQGAALAPGLADLGVLLPTTPLHHLLLQDAPYEALVMTSGNARGVPLCATDDEARATLGDVADGFLSHDRAVVRRVDDSVARTGGPGAAPFLIRRARGWVPEGLPLPEPSPEPVLALGGHLQVTVCLAADQRAVCSTHVGDLETESARRFLVETVGGLEDLARASGRVLAVDAHPDYPSAALGRRLAAERGGRVLEVPHHLAHAAAVLAERGRFPAPDERVAAVVLDGTGYGPDGTAWGGEVLLLNGGLSWCRVGHLEPLPLVGGERAVRDPWRVALAALATTDVAPLLEGTPMAATLEPAWIRAVVDLSRAGVGVPATGAGRLFEAAGALLGLAVENTWEGEAAARLEALASREDSGAPWPEVAEAWDAAPAVFPSRALLCALVSRQAAGQPSAPLAAGFHETFCEVLARCVEAWLPAPVSSIALGGGCLVNRRLRTGLERRLAARGHRVLLPERVPAGDGGLSYGQAVMAVVSENRGQPPRFEESAGCV